MFSLFPYREGGRSHPYISSILKLLQLFTNSLYIYIYTIKKYGYSPTVPDLGFPQFVIVMRYSAVTSFVYILLAWIVSTFSVLILIGISRTVNARRDKQLLIISKHN